MLRILVITKLFVMFFLPHNLCAQTKYLSSNDQISDIREYCNIINIDHIGAYRYNTKKEFYHFQDSIINTITDSISIESFYKIISSINSQQKCGHSKVIFKNNNWIKDKIFIPFSLYSLDNKIYILNDLSSSSSVLKYKELISINNIDIHKIMNIIKNQLPVDGYIQTRKKLSSEKSFSFFYALYINRDTVFSVVTRNENSNLDTIKVLSCSLNDLKGISKAKRSFGNKKEIFFNEQTHNKLYHLRINSLQMQPDTFKQKLDEIFLRIDPNKIKNLVVDLRGNRGGKVLNEEYLLSYLIRSKKRTYFKRRYIGKSKKILKANSNKYVYPHHNSFAGNIYFLMDGFSFSAAAEFLSIVKYHKLGPIIGEESGGANEGCNYGKNIITLSNSKIECIIPHCTSIFSKTTSPKGRGVIPDHTPTYTKNDIIKNKDKEMEFVINLIKNNKIDIEHE